MYLQNKNTTIGRTVETIIVRTGARIISRIMTDDDNDGNRASQGIGQSQSSSQNSQVVSGGDSIGSGNNFNFQNQENSGNNALAQQIILFLL